MRTLSAIELLSVWEQGLVQPPVQRALALLAAACPETPPEELAKLSIGRRDAHLLTLHEWLFGPQLACLANCPNCSERLELTFNVADIRVKLEGELTETLSLSVADYQLQFRLPNSFDLVAIAGQKSITLAQNWLFKRCLLSACYQGKEHPIDELPLNIKSAVMEQMAKADPQADTQLALTCACCGHQWQSVFDIVSFLWSEIDAWAYRVLREVHTLASAYGWRETDILAMSHWRRQLYLEMVSG